MISLLRSPAVMPPEHSPEGECSNWSQILTRCDAHLLAHQQLGLSEVQSLMEGHELFVLHVVRALVLDLFRVILNQVSHSRVLHARPSISSAAMSAAMSATPTWLLLMPVYMMSRS